MKISKSPIHLYTVLSLAPALMLTGILTVSGTAEIFKEGLGYIPGLGLNTLSFNAFTGLFHNREFITGFFYSLKVALISSVGALLLGILILIFFKNAAEKYKGIWYSFIIMSYLVSAIAVYNTYGDRGFIARILNYLGCYSGTLNIVYGKNGFGIALVYLLKSTPFVLLSLNELFLRVNSRYAHTAFNLGIGEGRYITKILLPLSKRGILTTWLVIFIFIFFSYEGFYFLGVSIPKSIGELCFIYYSSSNMEYRVQAMAISFIMITVSVLSAVLYVRAIGRRKEEDI